MYSKVLRRVSPAAGLLLLAILGLPKSAFGTRSEPPAYAVRSPDLAVPARFAAGRHPPDFSDPGRLPVAGHANRPGALRRRAVPGRGRHHSRRAAEPVGPDCAGRPTGKAVAWFQRVGNLPARPDGVNQYTTAQGLPSNAIQCLVPGRDGVVWVCTDSGLARMDVSRGEPRIEPSPTRRIENVRAACEDPSGNLWVGGDGPRVAIQRNGRFTFLAAERRSRIRPRYERCCAPATRSGREPATD